MVYAEWVESSVDYLNAQYDYLDAVIKMDSIVIDIMCANVDLLSTKLMENAGLQNG